MICLGVKGCGVGEMIQGQKQLKNGEKWSLTPQHPCKCWMGMAAPFPRNSSAKKDVTGDP